MVCGLPHPVNNTSVSGRTIIPVGMEFIPCRVMISMRVSGSMERSMVEVLSSSLTVIFTRDRIGMVPLTVVVGMYGSQALFTLVASTMV